MNVIPSDCELSDTDDSDDEEYDEVEGDLVKVMIVCASTAS